MSRVRSAAAGIISACATAADALREVWVASAMGGTPHRYRPEAHYMRGPGPKWFAKNVRLSTSNLERL